MNKSFTLIEILVVIVVIGIISAFILVGMSSITSSANFAKGKAFLNSMDNSLLLARVSQWKFDESSSATAYDYWGINNGTLADTSGACSFTGTLKCPQTVTSGCPSNNCLSFDGVDDYVECGSNASITTDLNAWTVSAWVKPNDVSVNTLIGFATAPSYRPVIRLNNTTGAPIIYMNASNFRYFANSTWTTMKNGSWHNVVFILPGGAQNDITSAKMYLDSQEANPSSTSSIDAQTAKNILRIGRDIGYYYSGLMDDVRVYNQAIPTSEIQQNYFVGLNKLYKNNGISLKEFCERIVELKSNTANNE